MLALALVLHAACPQESARRPGRRPEEPIEAACQHISSLCGKKQKTTFQAGGFWS
jgi:hypothetical protein